MVNLLVMEFIGLQIDQKKILTARVVAINEQEVEPNANTRKVLHHLKEVKDQVIEMVRETMLPKIVLRTLAPEAVTIHKVSQ